MTCGWNILEYRPFGHPFYKSCPYVFTECRADECWLHEGDYEQRHLVALTCPHRIGISVPYYVEPCTYGEACKDRRRCDYPETCPGERLVILKEGGEQP